MPPACRKSRWLFQNWAGHCVLKASQPRADLLIHVPVILRRLRNRDYGILHQRWVSRLPIASHGSDRTHVVLILSAQSMDLER